MAVAATPPHPVNTVLVRMRRDGGPAEDLRAVAEASQAGVQWFRAALPPVAEGRRLDYRVELSRAGHRLATLPPDGSWLTVTGAPALPEPQQAAERTGSAVREQAPRWSYEMVFLGALTLNLRPEVIGETPEGYRINFLVTGGTMAGPRVDAVVRPGGGDWMCIRRDGIGVLDVRFTYETTDGALILDRAGGVFDLGPGGYADVAAGRLTGHPPVYATATFSTAHPHWMWLNRCQGFGIGRVALEDLQVQCDIYVPSVGDRLADA